MIPRYTPSVDLTFISIGVGGTSAVLRFRDFLWIFDDLNFKVGFDRLDFRAVFFILDFRAGFDCGGTSAVLRFRDFSWC